MVRRTRGFYMLRVRLCGIASCDRPATHMLVAPDGEPMGEFCSHCGSQLLGALAAAMAELHPFAAQGSASSESV